MCLQETKCEEFDIRTIRTFCPRRFDRFAFAPSVGASGGILVIWNSGVFTGTLIEIQRFGVVVSFTSVHNAETWTLVSVYGPCDGPLRDDFVHWLYHLTIPPTEHWLLLGDFNFIRSMDNRNLPGGNVNDIFLFNEIIGHLGLLELPLKEGEAIHGPLCRETLCSSNLIGSLQPRIGFPFIQTLWYSP